ncbi:metal-dependent transcriptional regulator [Anaeroselena agilis]|uniref:Metal-dependent transcriptional regulator n=1 Tax=Anaeroselena agilis TaxID=3063788 RepID=A0ABU3NSH3_9FIRM|nr:metal-dependent transcriptional regulator [Selenomonadales bacterium 4137-cl]
MLSPSLEDYLEEVYRFSITQEVVRVSDISHKLNFALPSVSKALGKLRARGYISYQKYGYIGLTDKGRQMGSYLVKRNQVLQDFLMLLRTPCDVAAEAEAMEHYLSRETIESIQVMMAFMRDEPEVYQSFVDYANKHDKKK